MEEIVASCECGTTYIYEDIECENIEYLSSSSRIYYPSGGASWTEYFKCNQCGETIEFYAET